MLTSSGGGPGPQRLVPWLGHPTSNGLPEGAKRGRKPTVKVAEKLSDTWSALSGLDDAAFWDGACAAFGNLGFDQVIYAAAVQERRDEPPSIRTSDNLEGWASAYRSEKDYVADPFFSYGCRLDYPVFTGVSHLHRHPFLSPREAEVIARAGDFGFRSGVAIPVLVDRPGHIVGWNLGSTGGVEATVERMSDLGAFLPSFANLVQQRLEKVATSPSPLSPREREVLLWLGRGDRTDQIAHRLGLKPVTVSMHLRGSRQKLGARTREQALAIAVARGWITP